VQGAAGECEFDEGEWGVWERIVVRTSVGRAKSGDGVENSIGLVRASDILRVSIKGSLMLM
jgi:hypothetical protein